MCERRTAVLGYYSESMVVGAVLASRPAQPSNRNEASAACCITQEQQQSSERRCAWPAERHRIPAANLLSTHETPRHADSTLFVPATREPFREEAECARRSRRRSGPRSSSALRISGHPDVSSVGKHSSPEPPPPSTRRRSLRDATVVDPSDWNFGLCGSEAVYG